MNSSNSTQSISRYSDWYTRGRLSRYVDGVWAISSSSSLVSATQPAGDMSDPPVYEVMLGINIPLENDCKFKLDFGADVFEGVDDCGAELLTAVPANYRNKILVDKPHKILYLGVDVGEFERTLESANLRATADLGVLHSKVFQDDFLKQGLYQLRDWCSPEHASFGLAKESLMLAMILRLAELSGNTKLPALTARQGTLARWQIKRVLEQLQSNLAVSPSLDELAQSIGLSKFHFCRAFKQTLGHSPMQYLIGQRVEQATVLLKNSKVPIAEVAAQVGYEDSAYFARLYRSKTDLMPSEVRRRAWGRSPNK